MNGKQILTDMAESFASLASVEAVMQGGLTLAIRGQYTSLLIATSTDNKESIQNAVDLFSFFTMQAIGMSVITASISAIQKFPIEQHLEIGDMDVFEKEHSIFRNTGSLPQAQHKLAQEFLADLPKQILEMAGELQKEMLGILSKEEFPDVIGVE